EVSNLNSGMTATEKSTSSLGSKLGSGLGINGIQKTTSSVQSLSSRVQEAESFASALGSKFNAGLGVSGIQKTSSSVQSLSSRVQEAGSFATALGSNMNKSSSIMSGGWTKVTGAANTAGSAIKNIGSRLAESANSMSMFSASLATMIGTMGTQQVYDATVGKANSYLGMIQYWNTVYGSSASQNYQNTVNSMYTQHYQAKSDTTRTLQLLSNTMPIGTDSSSIASLTPIVAAYKNFYKAMKPEQAAMANIEAPQDIAAVFSGNTGEIRASPLASQLKTIASLPQDQKMAALQDLFSKNGVMNYLDGITAYDKNMNKLNATMDNLSITTGEELIPAATNVLTKINDFLQGLGSNGKYLVYLTGAVAGLAALGGVGSLAVMGLNGVYKGFTTVGSGAAWFG
ncbi:MAG: hypothetical protein K8E24_015250, partial [Methanobacterium paludis]|nr:hypothetical protein [Methanobacterium paludis]